MAVFDEVCQMASDFADIADFVTVYIEEAHAADAWKFTTNQYQISKHRSLTDRLAAANVLSAVRDNIPFPILVDSMVDDTNIAYAGLYERLYILLDGCIVYVGGVGPEYYLPHEVKEWLVTYQRKRC